MLLHYGRQWNGNFSQSPHAFLNLPLRAIPFLGGEGGGMGHFERVLMHCEPPPCAAVVVFLFLFLAGEGGLWNSMNLPFCTSLHVPFLPPPLAE